MGPGGHAVLDEPGLARLFETLKAQGYEVVGPSVRDGAIVYDTLASIEDLPRGVSDEQRGGRYRLTRREDDAFFGYAVGPHSWKRFLHPPLLTLWRVRHAEQGFDVSAGGETPRYAFLGVRACELAAIEIQDRVLAGGAYVDPAYKARRAAAFIVAASCEPAAGTCFCASLDTGPRVRAGFDVALTEILDGGHRFLVETGSARGSELLAQLPTRPATPEDAAAAEAVLARVEARVAKKLERSGLKELLYRQYENPRWEEVAKRCLTCANCTMVCPTCFCVSVDDTSDLDGSAAERRRRWDSCFTMDFSYIHGGSVRTSAGARYRQWITHKLATWQDQFGSLGCVGCGRCITWCPVGIDITEEIEALRQAEARKR
jgi:ferredoxin